MIDGNGKSWAVSYIRAVTSRNKDSLDRVMNSWEYEYRQAVLTLLSEIISQRYKFYNSEVGDMIRRNTAIKLFKALVSRENTKLGYYMATTRFGRP